MRKNHDTLLVAIYNTILLTIFGVLVWYIREWWLLFMLLGLASSHSRED